MAEHQGGIEPLTSSLPTPPVGLRFIAVCPTCPWQSPREYGDSLAAANAFDRHVASDAHVGGAPAELGYDQQCRDCGVSHYPTEPCRWADAGIET